MVLARKKTKKESLKILSYKQPLAVGYHKKKSFLLYRNLTNKGQTLHITPASKDGLFGTKSFAVFIMDEKKKKEDIARCKDFRFGGDDKKLVMTYVRETESGLSLVYATTTDKKKWKVEHVISKIKTAGIVRQVTAKHKTKKDITSHIYFGDHVVRVAKSDNKKWDVVEPPRVPYWHFFEGVPFNVVGGVLADEGYVLFYAAEHVVDIMKDVNLSDQKIGEERLLKIGLALFSENDPTRLLWQTELPIVEVPLETYGNVSVLGVLPVTDKKITHYQLYIGSQEGEIGYVEIPHDIIAHHKHVQPVQLKKWKDNPILTPTHLDWEVDGAFNPTALHLNNKIHLLYRASGVDGFSKIGYASSTDGLHIDERLKKPIYTPQYWFEYTEDRDGHVSDIVSASGGTGWGGCEDPKVTQIGDRIYMTYVAHTGQWPTRTVLTSISVDDFLNKKWRWTKPMLMSPPGVGSKSVVIMPEKINGKYVIFHRHWPNVMIDLVDTLEFGEGKQWLEGHHMIRPRKSYWDSKKISIASTPIKTKDGWLTIYNAVDRMDGGKYKIGAMLLDSNDPTHVVSRCRKPILSPEEFYENDGKPGVAYPGGAIDLGGILHIYYGGGDKVCAVAQIPTEELLWHLKRDGEPVARITHVGKI